MTQVINDNLQINGDTYLKADNYVSLHYGNRGRLGQTPNFNPDQDRNGLWVEGSTDGSESGGIFMNGNTMCLWSPGDNDLLRIYDEDNLSSSAPQPKFLIDGSGNVGIGTGDIYIKEKSFASIHYGNRGKLGQTPNFNPDRDRNGLWVEGSTDGSESGGIFMNGNTMCLWSPGDNDLLRIYDEDNLSSSAPQPKFLIDGSGNVGIGTTSPQAELHVNGNIIATGDIVLQNADCAEEFTVKDLEMIEPGTVMVLDEEDSLRPSTEAYDKKVAGVVSGAGDLKPGLVLDKQPESTNRMPIALMGKVYCKIDAEYAAIEVGDLLTTSPTPGHAMKATDPTKAFGTIIGKALRPLETGKGLIPILVTLQ